MVHSKTGTPPPQTDEELMRRWQGGDSVAGEELFDRCFASIYRFFVTKVSDAADDLTQETLLACVRGRDRFRFESKFRTYMFAVARRLLRRYLERRADRAEVNMGSQSALDLGPSPSTLIQANESERLSLEALRSLPLDYQIAIELRHWEGLTGPELAAVLGVPEGTVRSRLRRGRIQLEQKLRELASSPRALDSTRTRLDGWARDMGALAREQRKEA